MEGAVKFYNSQRGYGFITNDEGDKDTYVNREDIRANIGNRQASTIDSDAVAQLRPLKNLGGRDSKPTRLE